MQTAKSIAKYQKSGQAKDLQQARDMTKEEFRMNFQKMLWALDSKLTAKGYTMQQFQPWFSWDHNYAQEYADLTFSPAEVPAGCAYYVPGLDFGNVRLPLGKYSADCHR